MMEYHSKVTVSPHTHFTNQKSAINNGKSPRLQAMGLTPAYIDNITAGKIDDCRMLIYEVWL
jgi:hypothetical protein